MSKIKKIIARQILDSRGNPTIEADVFTEAGNCGRAAVPSGASTGSKEALELRDGRKDYFLGKSVEKAVANVNDLLAPNICGKESSAQREIDNTMLEMDGTENKSKMGANALLAVSLASARAGALDANLSLFNFLKERLDCPNDFSGNYQLPAPLMNIINGGEHASNNLDIQEFMIVPHLNKSFKENLRSGVEVFHHLKKVLEGLGHSTNVGDEGGFAPNFQSHKEAIDCIIKAIESAGYRPGEDISISLDSAASEFYSNGSYQMEGKTYSNDQMIEYYSTLCSEYPIYSIEDGLDEADNEGWKKLTLALGKKCMLVGDDLFVTNKSIFEKGIENGEANSILIKVNQIGTLSETFDTLDLGFKNNYKAVISHRSGETGDHFIADLAVASGAGHIKTGSASRSDRMEKYNQLLRIEEELGESAAFNRVK